MTASASRRRRIVRDQKYPAAFQVARYVDAEDAIRRFLLGQYGADGLEFQRRSLLEMPCETDFEDQGRRNCAEAIERFVSLSDRLELHDLTLRRSDRIVPKLASAGVDI